MKQLIKKLLRENLFPVIDFGETDHGKIINVEYGREKIILTLYRGLKDLKDNSEHNPELVPYKDKYMLRVDNYPDKLIWFTREQSFAKNYNGWGLITYKLPVIKHKKFITYEDGFKEDSYVSNEEVESGYGRGKIKSDTDNDSHLYGDIELPDNWFWSYKMQKHIVCDTNLIIDKDQVTRNI